MAYSRVFIALKQGCSDFTRDIRGSVGRCIIELRNGAGRLMLQAQGLKNNCNYRVCVLTKDSYAEVTKPFYIDAMGKGELKWEFQPLKLGIEVSDIKAVVILSGDKAPLIGFVEGEYNWQRCLMAKADEPASVNVAKIEEIPVKKDDKEDKEKLICIINEFDKNINEIKEYSRIGTAEAENSLFSRENVSPFGDDGIKWIKANLKELCLVKSLWKYINNPFVIKSCRDYHYILLGKSDDCYYMAVPGKYDREYRLEAQAQGFKEIKPMNGDTLEQGEDCYYILKC